MVSWSITPVDVGSLIGVYEGAKDRRTRQMMLERDIAKEDREIELQSKLMSVYSRLYQPKGGGLASAGSGAVGSPAAPGSGLVASPEDRAQNQANIEAGLIANDGPPPPVAMRPDGSPPVVPPMGGPAAPTALVDPAQLPPRTDGVTLNQDALRELYTLDPKAAIEVQKNVFDMNAAQLKAVGEQGERLASAAFHLKSVPMDERPAELQAMAPMLAQMGIDPQMLSGADLSDRGLDRYLRIGQSYKDLASDDRAEREFGARQEDRRLDNARADAGLDIRRGALDLARGRESRVAAGGGKSGGGADVGGMSTDALIALANGGQ